MSDNDAHLPDSFWEARPVLGQIRQAAQASQFGPDGLLNAVLARTSAITSHLIVLPGLGNGQAYGSLNYAGATVGEPGDGKSASMAIAERLVPDEHLTQLSVGSGEGLIDAYFTLEQVTGPDGPIKGQREKRQTIHRVLFYEDEGEALFRRATGSGSIILPTLRSLWSGGQTGQANAEKERKRQLRSHGYRFALVMGLQESKAAGLLADADGGTPQRFIFLRARERADCALDPDNLPKFPAPISLLQPVGNIDQVVIDVDDAVKRQIRHDRHAVNTVR